MSPEQGRSSGQKDPRRTVVALRYAPESSTAPRVTAKGRGDIGEAILAAARAHGVPVREDRDLVELLAACDLLDEIPAELYQAVAHILTYLHALNCERAADAKAQ